MPFTVTLAGQFLKFVDSDNTKPEYEFPLANTATLFDDPAGAIELSCGKLRLYFTAAEITSPSIADYAALKVQLATWKAAAGLVVSGKLTKPTDSFTTAVGATPYAVGDVINPDGAASLRSINVGCNSGYLTGLAVEMDNASPLSTPSPLPTLRVRFFDASDASLLIADNAADDILYSNNVRRLGHVDLPIMVAETGRLVASDETIRFPFANLTNGLLYYKIINTVGTPTLGTAGVGRGVFVRAKVDQN
jgi:hypothetical protein